MNSFRQLLRTCSVAVAKRPANGFLSRFSQSNGSNEVTRMVIPRRSISSCQTRLADEKGEITEDVNNRDAEEKEKKGDTAFRIPKHHLSGIDKFYVVATGLGTRGNVPDEASHEFMEKVHSRRRILINVIVMVLTGVFAFAIISMDRRNRNEKIAADVERKRAKEEAS